MIRSDMITVTVSKVEKTAKIMLYFRVADTTLRKYRFITRVMSQSHSRQLHRYLDDKITNNLVYSIVLGP